MKRQEKKTLQLKTNNKIPKHRISISQVCYTVCVFFISCGGKNNGLWFDMLRDLNI